MVSYWVCCQLKLEGGLYFFSKQYKRETESQHYILKKGQNVRMGRVGLERLEKESVMSWLSGPGLLGLLPLGFLSPQ